METLGSLQQCLLRLEIICHKLPSKSTCPPDWSPRSASRTLSWVRRSCQAHHLRYASEKQMVEEDHGRALTAVSGLRCSSTFAKIATKFAFSSQRQDPAAALGVQRPLIGLASENVADDIFHPLPWDNHAKSTSKSEFEKHSHED